MLQELQSKMHQEEAAGGELGCCCRVFNATEVGLRWRSMSLLLQDSSVNL